jgi:hypothetical protein
MNIDFIETKNNCPIVIVDNFYELSEVKLIKEELISLHEVSKLGIHTNYDVDKDEDGIPKQKSNSLFLDDVFIRDRSLSKILSINKKLFTNEELKQVLLEKSLFFNYIYESNKDTTLVNFYSVGGFYKKHKDATCFTALSFFELEPFLGGDLLFPDYAVKIPSLEGRMVIFPGFLPHTAEEITSGVRVSMSQFINIT